jgi:hypothetical protein
MCASGCGSEGSRESFWTASYASPGSQLVLRHRISLQAVKLSVVCQIPVVSFLESQGLQGTMGLLMQLELICGAADEPTRLSRASNSRPNVPYSEQPSPAAISSTVHISNSFSVRRRSLLHRWCLLTGLCHTLQSDSCRSFALFLRPFPARYHRSI